MSIAASGSMSPTILVVEDSEDVRSSVTEYLRAVGFGVVETANAAEALEAIRSETHIDLVFSNVNMPGAMDGFALALWLANNRPGLPVLLTSGEACPDLRRCAPHCHFLPKPYYLETVERDIRDQVDGSPIS